MDKEYYFVYCKGILGVKTNNPDFKWTYGSTAPKVSFEEFEKCAIQFNVNIMPEKELQENENIDCSFQAYDWNAGNKTIFYRRTFPAGLKIGYNIKSEGNRVFADIGKNYYRFVKNRIMNLHGIYYILSDLANVILLRNGFLTLYASAAFYEPKKKGVICFAAPNTGKTLTVTNLCEKYGYGFVSEDVAISDGKKVFSCPWTSSYRSKNESADSAGSLGRCNVEFKNDIVDNCEITDLFVFVKEKERIGSNKEAFLKKALMLNGYLFNYFTSPIVKILGFFDEDYNLAWSDLSEKIINEMAENSSCFTVGAQKPEDFSNIVHREVTGEYENFSDN